MAEVGMEVSNGNMHGIAYLPIETQDQTQEQQRPDESMSPTHVLSGVSSLDSEDFPDSYEERSQRLELDRSQEEQIEKLKEFLSEAQLRSEDLVTQRDADTVKALERMHIGTTSESGLGARLESAARTNLEIEKQTAASYFPSETVYFQEHSLKEVLDEASPVLLTHMTTTVAAPSSKVPATSPMKSPRNVDADNALKNELDCLFQERAARFRLE